MFLRNATGDMAEARRLYEANLPVVSAAYGAESKETSEGSLVERHHRAMDLFTPVWNLLDLLPRGREDWMPKHFYRE